MHLYRTALGTAGPHEEKKVKDNSNVPNYIKHSTQEKISKRGTVIIVFL